MQDLPVNLYCAAELRELDRRIILEEGISGFELMNRAGGAAFACLRLRWPDAHKLLIVCGAGNNAGDGYVIARLALAAGFAVQVYGLAEPSRLAGDALLAYQAFIAANGLVQKYSEHLDFTADVVVDALLGIGLSRAVTGLYADVIDAINASGLPVLAVDIPSGINADTGAVMATAVHAECTFTFIGLKQGLFTGEAPDYCGEIIYERLARSETVYKQVTSTINRIERKYFPKRPRHAHKGMNGHVLIVGGACGYSGAALLAGEAALRVGSGLVSLATRPEHAGFITMHRPELMCHGVETAEQLAILLEKASVVVLGPGLGQSAWAKLLFTTVMHFTKPLVVDADGLNILAEQPVYRDNWILTPHPGEAARLLRTSTAGLQQDRFAAVSALQSKFGGVAILKGAGTLIADNSTIGLSTTGNPGMASGGMGDVLAGVIAGLLAQGESLVDAARQGVYGHGLAADYAALDGERGLLAGDLMPYLRKWMN